MGGLLGTPRGGRCSRHLDIAYQDERSTLGLKFRGAMRRGTLPPADRFLSFSGSS